MKQLYVFVFLLTLLFNVGCKHEALRTNRQNLPTVMTAAATAIGSTSASSGGDVTNEGSGGVSARGVCWSTTPSPIIANATTTDGSGGGAFQSSLQGLVASTTYYLRAYATNSAGTAYGNEVSFTTLANTSSLANVATQAGTFNSGTNTISTGGIVASDGGTNVSARGVVWSTSINPTINDNRTTDGTGTGNFTSTIAGIAANTTYYIRAYATNAAGTAYGNTFTVNTPAANTSLPSVTTSATTFNVSNNTISSGGNVTAAGGSAVTARGVCWATTPSPTIANNTTTDGAGTGNFTTTISGVTANTTYYIRAYATNSSGTVYGNQVTVFTGTSGSFTIGQQFGGGVIFFVDASGQHGLIAAPQDAGSAGGTVWDYSNNTTSLGATSNDDGKTNTSKIVTALGQSQNYAARLCTTYNGGGFNDWFLPSRNQLSQLYQQRNVVGSFNLSSGMYWSSTEQDEDKAWAVEFENGSNGGRLRERNKDDNLLVRPVRAF